MFRGDSRSGGGGRFGGHSGGGFRGGSGGFRGGRSGGGGFAPVKVGDELEVTIEGVGEKGDGIAKKNGFVLFVPNTKQGDTVKIRITKVLNKVGFAEVVSQGGSSESSSEEGAESSEEAPAEESGSSEEPSEEQPTEDSESFGEDSKE